MHSLVTSCKTKLASPSGELNYLPPCHAGDQGDPEPQVRYRGIYFHGAFLIALLAQALLFGGIFKERLVEHVMCYGLQPAQGQRTATRPLKVHRLHLQSFECGQSCSC